MLIHIRYIETDLKCPVCERVHVENEWYNRYINSQYNYLKMRCKGCKTWLGADLGMTGKLIVWELSEQDKPKRKTK